MGAHQNAGFRFVKRDSKPTKMVRQLHSVGVRLRRALFASIPQLPAQGQILITRSVPFYEQLESRRLMSATLLCSYVTIILPYHNQAFSDIAQLLYYYTQYHIPPFMSTMQSLNSSRDSNMPSPAISRNDGHLTWSGYGHYDPMIQVSLIVALEKF